MRSFFRTRVSCTDRAREEVAQHGSKHGPCSLFSVARVFNTGRVGEACALIFRVARGVLINTDRVDCLACTGLVGSARGVFAIFGSARGVQIGTGQAIFLHGSSNFLLLR